ncbi:MAG: CCA tRNA nucleotidyltransferase [Syntrophobacteraceae bacterium]
MFSTSAKPGLSFIPRDVLAVMERIGRAGFDVWLVGGAPRDFLLGIEPRDWDLATSAPSAAIVSLFPSVIPVGIRHGTVQVHTRTRDIEVTSFAPGGEAGILIDLARRDFTINSIALSYPGGELLDPNAGREDLNAGLIKGVGDPCARFLEDPLRIIRGARISAIYGFRIDQATFEAMEKCGARLESVSGERIRDEFLKILTSREPAIAFVALRQTGTLQRIFPFLDRANVFDETINSITHCPDRIRLRLAALFSKAADSNRASARVAGKTLKSWNMSKRLIEEVSTIVGRRIGEEAFSWSDERIRGFITEVGPQLLEDIIYLLEAEMISRTRSPEAGMEKLERFRANVTTQLGLISAFSVRELALGGNDIIKILGIAPGPEVGKVLKALFDLVQKDPGLNTPQGLTRIVEQKYKKRDET